MSFGQLHVLFALLCFTIDIIMRVKKKIDYYQFRKKKSEQK